MKLRRIAGALGAEIEAVDLAARLSPDAVADIRRAFLEHQVVFFRDQPLTPEQFMAFARSMRLQRPMPRAPAKSSPGKKKSLPSTLRNTLLCVRTRKRAARRCTSTSGTPCASAA